MTGHAQLKFVMMECSKTQIRLTRPYLSSMRNATDRNKALQKLNCLNLRKLMLNMVKWAKTLIDEGKHLVFLLKILTQCELIN